MIQLLDNPPDSRTINFVVYTIGNSGKSWLCKYLMTNRESDVQYMRFGKEGDLAYLNDETKSIFLFDVPSYTARLIHD